LQVCATGRFIGADEALRIGLVTSVHPAAELHEAARSLADAMCATLPGALRDLKALLRCAQSASRDEQLAMERTLQAGRIAELSRLLPGSGA
jgi:enoyl-CoA hydratase/carnithine racemase